MILSAHTARQLRNASLSALYRVAYDHNVDLADVMASITQSQPSPASRAPAARTSPVPVAVQAEEVPSVTSSAEPSLEILSTEGVNEPLVTVADGANTGGDDEVARTENACTAHDGRADERGRRADAVALGSDVESVTTGKSVEPSGSAAPIKAAKVTNRQRVRECHEAHPDWTAAQIAAELGMGTQQVRVVASHISLTLPKSPAKQQEPVEPAAAPTPRTVPKQPPAVKSEPPTSQPSLPGAKTLKARVRDVHVAHPEWTAAQIGNYLGHSQTSVSTVLGIVRREARPVEEPQQFTGRREMVDHYGEIAKRLGK